MEDIDQYLRQTADMGDSAQPDLGGADLSSLGKDTLKTTPTPKGKPKAKPAVPKGPISKDRADQLAKDRADVNETMSTVTDEELAADDPDYDYDEDVPLTTDDTIDLSDTMSVQELIDQALALTEEMKRDPYQEILKKMAIKHRQELRYSNEHYDDGDPQWVRDMKYKPSDEELEEEFFNENIEPELDESAIDPEMDDESVFNMALQNYINESGGTGGQFAALKNGDPQGLAQKDIDGFMGYMNKHYPGPPSDERIKNIYNYVSDLRQKVINRVVSDVRMKNIIGALKGRVL
jgi:hypothetical protein